MNPIAYRITVTGAALAAALAVALIYRSCEFDVTPFPDDLWQFTFKAEQQTFVAELLRSLGVHASGRAIR
jgi:hypothetical protein